MKKLFFILGLFVILASCRSHDKEVYDDVTIDYSEMNKHYLKDGSAAGDAAGEGDAAHEGLALIEGSDCFTCHKPDEKFIGPSYKEVSAKYTENDLEMLALKIIDGGAGNWGEVPMTPHPNVNMESAKTMVKYILGMDSDGVEVTEYVAAAPADTGSEEPAGSQAGGNDGEALIKGSDCFACHAVASPMVGPSYQEVAARYTESDMDMLAQKIIDGGAGNWGDVPMSPHPDVSKESAKTMVKYILSVK